MTHPGMARRSRGNSMIKKLLGNPPKVINIGLSGFARDLSDRGVPVVHVDWSPPAGGNPKLRDLLSKLKS